MSEKIEKDKLNDVSGGISGKACGYYSAATSFVTDDCVTCKYFNGRLGGCVKHLPGQDPDELDNIARPKLDPSRTPFL